MFRSTSLESRGMVKEADFDRPRMGVRPSEIIICGPLDFFSEDLLLPFDICLRVQPFDSKCQIYLCKALFLSCTWGYFQIFPIMKNVTFYSLEMDTVQDVPIMKNVTFYSLEMDTVQDVT